MAVYVCVQALHKSAKANNTKNMNNGFFLNLTLKLAVRCYIFPVGSSSRAHTVYLQVYWTFIPRTAPGQHAGLMYRKQMAATHASLTL